MQNCNNARPLFFRINVKDVVLLAPSYTNPKIFLSKFPHPNLLPMEKE
jgi:hypothetical protein